MIRAGVPGPAHVASEHDAAAAALEGLAPADPIGARLAVAGFTSIVVPATGVAVDPARLCRAREALAYHSAMADAVLAVIGLGAFPVARAAAPALAARLLDPLRRGETLCGFALTEPGAGSDVQAIATLAEVVPGGYRLTGKKTFISNAPIAGWFTIFARAPGGITAFVLERGTPGLTIVEDVPLAAPHPIGSLVLEGAVVPEAHRLGAEGEGLRLALATLDTFRASVAAAACGLAARAIDEAIAHVRARTQFGKPLAEQQLTQARLADGVTDLWAARGLVRRACEALAAGASDAKLHVAMAKLFATEAAQRIIDGAVQLHGGLGVVVGVKVEELTRDVRPLRIYEGTSEIQQLIIARQILGR